MMFREIFCILTAISVVYDMIESIKEDNGITIASIIVYMFMFMLSFIPFINMLILIIVCPDKIMQRKIFTRTKK